MARGAAPKGQQDRSGQKAKPFQPAIGRDFGNVEEVEAKTRDFLARVIAAGSGSTVGVTGIYGLVTGNYVPVIAVWAIAAPFVGALVAFYFGPKRNDTG